MRFTRIGALIPALALCTLATAGGEARDLHSQFDFQGRYLVSISDADMVASAYVNGDLGPREGRDALSVIPLGGDPRSWKAAETFASNSVAGPPNAVALTPDGRYAVVIETWTERPSAGDQHRFSDLEHGNRVKTFDLTDPAQPVLVQEHTTLRRPDAVSINGAGNRVAISYHPSGDGTETPLAVYRFESGRLIDRQTPSIAGWEPGQRLIDIAFHPDRNILAMIESTGGATLRFAELGDDGTLSITGNVVDLERAPYRVLWTPDGRHVVVNALYWGPDIAGTWVEAPRGSVSTIRMNAETRADGSVRHAFISRATAGVSPEGLAVSPDGRWVATTNLERSYLPYDDSRITWYSSITLAALDQQSGQLTEVGTFPYDGILPEAAVFDNSGTFLAVATFDHFNDRKAGGSIDFWRIQADPFDIATVRLVKTEHSVPVARGAHSMVIAR